MTIPRPQVAVPPPAFFAPVMQSVGMPPPKEVTQLAPAWVHANYRLTFEEDSGLDEVMVRRLLHSPGYDTLQNEMAALTLVSTLDLPVVRKYRLAPRGTLPWPAALSQILPGVHGMRVMRRHPEMAPAICRRVGQLMRTLADFPLGHFGTRADTGRFVPRRATWPEEWAAVTGEWLAMCRGRGTDLGELTNRLAALIDERGAALAKVGEFALVHGDLHPSNLLFGRPLPGSIEPPLSGIVDWEGAFLGDPLCEWALCMELPSATLGHIVQGYGADRVEAWLCDPAAIERLEVYTWTRALRRMAFCGGTLLRGAAGRRRSYGLEYARVVTKEALREGSVAEKLREALRLGTNGGIAQHVPYAPAHRVLWRSLEALRFRPPLRQVHAAAFSGALAAALLAAQRPVDEQKGGWFSQGEQLADMLGPQVDPGFAEPVDNPLDWCDTLHAEVVESVRRTGRPMVLVLWWVVRAALDQLDVEGLWPVNSHILHGIEALVRTVLAFDDATTAGEPVEMALLGWAAARALAVAPLEEVFAERAREQWQDAMELGQTERLSRAGEEPSPDATPDALAPLLAATALVLGDDWLDLGERSSR